MKNVIYLKKYKDEIESSKLKKILKKIEYFYQYLFNIIIKEEIDGYNIWTLPIKKECSEKKLNKIIKKCINSKNIYVLSNDLKKKNIYKAVENNGIDIYNTEIIKKLLLDKILEYINKIQKKHIQDIELAILLNFDTEINLYILKNLAMKVKNLKIVSSNIYKFKKLEEELYTKHGIAIQFSNSNRKSLSKSNFIVNLDFKQTQINEYNINNKAIIINCIEENIKIKKNLFNGVIINSCKINIKKETKAKIPLALMEKKEYDLLEVYGSKLLKYNVIDAINKIERDKAIINILIGNNGELNKKEFTKKY